MKLNTYGPGETAEKKDEDLVKLSLADQENFVYLVRRYEGKLLSYIKKISRVSNEEAEDILQDVFIKVYQNLNDFDTDLKFSSWIYRITRNQAISNFRRAKSRPLYGAVEINDIVMNTMAADIDLNKEVDGAYLKEQIKNVLDKLDSKYREVLILKYLEEKNYQEISDIIKKPMGTVASMLNKAKKKFKLELLNQGNNTYEKRIG